MSGEEGKRILAVDDDSHVSCDGFASL
jgi:hypothetical protein